MERLAKQNRRERTGDQRNIPSPDLEPSERTWQTLRYHDLDHLLPSHLQEATRALDAIDRNAPTLDTVHALAELEFLAARRLEHRAPDDAVSWYMKCVLHSYTYLFDPRFDALRTGYDPQFRTACDLYNTALEQFLRYAQDRDMIQPGRN
ncbi:MAG: hypothetical protein ABGZ17_02235, partial [Planctomycetaceae bacterium]